MRTPSREARRCPRFSLVPMKLRLRNRSGSVLTLVAVSLVAMVSVAALVSDLGMLYTAHSEAQRAADAAALAGASAFQEEDPAQHPVEASALATERARAWAQKNGIRNEQITDGVDAIDVSLDLANAAVTVTIRRPVISLLFARLLGFDQAPVSASATAVAQRAGSSTCLKPFAIPDMWAELSGDDKNGNKIWDFDQGFDCKGKGCVEPEDWSFDGAPDTYDHETTGYGSHARDGQFDSHNQRYNQDEFRRLPIKINSATLGTIPSWWFPWDITKGGGGAKEYKEAIKGCVTGDFQIGGTLDLDSAETKNGNMPKPTYDAIIDLIDNGDGVHAADPTAEWDSINNTVVKSTYGANWRSSPRVITVAVVNPVDIAHGLNNMQIVDFATLFLEDPRKTYPSLGFKAPITARLLKFAPGGTGPETGQLVRVLRLVK